MLPDLVMLRAKLRPPSHAAPKREAAETEGENARMTGTGTPFGPSLASRQRVATGGWRGPPQRPLSA